MVAKTVEASFPSNIERVVAAALLRLSSSSPIKESSDDSCSPENIQSSEISASKSGGSSIAATRADEGSSRAQRLKVVAFLSGSHDLKLKIVRKERSKSICISDGKKLKTSKPEPTTAPPSSETVSEITTEASLCLSSSSTAQSFDSKSKATEKLTKRLMPRHMGHRAAAILRILSNGSASEVRIRQLLGDSPSTSKALRMLLKQQEVKRYGAGGRADPYIYMIA